MTSNLRFTRGTRRRAVGTGLIAGVAVAVIGTGAAAIARADDADVLEEAASNFTTAENAFAGVPANDLALYQVGVADTGLMDVNALTGVGAAENGILSYDNGEFASLVTPFFNDLDQNWLQASDALISANTAVATAVTDGSGLGAAELGAIAPDIQVMSDQFFTGIIDQTSYLLTVF